MGCEIKTQGFPISHSWTFTWSPLREIYLREIYCLGWDSSRGLHPDLQDPDTPSPVSSPLSIFPPPPGSSSSLFCAVFIQDEKLPCLSFYPCLTGVHTPGKYTGLPAVPRSCCPLINPFDQQARSNLPLSKARHCPDIISCS